MRLHRLEVMAFGPYPKQESVDFDALGADGLFLLHGDTGAGKTTLLDAVAFALFGSVPGARGEAKRLRCDYAEPDTVTEVGLELTVQGHRLRVTRRPEYERTKKTGGGTTTQRAKASLAWLGNPPSGHDPDGLIRIDEVNRTVGRLLGMTAEQFFQVVLLPQGEFARFLRADTGEREKLLERLFGTERFARVEEWFQATRAEHRRVVQELRSSARELVARVAQAAGDEPPDEERPVDSDWLGELGDRLAKEVAHAESEHAIALDGRRVAEAELEHARRLADRVRRVRAARASLAELDALADQRHAWGEELSAALRCAPVLVAEQAADRARAALDLAWQKERRAVDVLDEWGQPDIDASPPILRQRAGELTEEAGGLRGLVEEAEQQEIDTVRLDKLRRREADLTETVERITTELASFPGALATARAELDAAITAGARIDGLGGRLADLSALHADAMSLPAVQLAADRASAALVRAVDEHQRARERLLDVRRRRLDGMAAELAAGLRPGQPCPVCGGAEHPAPAIAAEPVGDADERAAAGAEERAREAREHATRVSDEATLRLTALAERLGGRSCDELAAARSEAEQELRRVSAEADLLTDRAARVEQLETEADRARIRLSTAERDQSVLSADRTTLAERIAERAGRLASAKGAFPDVGARRAHLLTVADALNTLASRRTARQTAEDNHAQRDIEVTVAAEHAGFGDRAEALAATRSAEVIAELEERLAEADRREAAATAVLAEPELAGVSADTVVDLDGAQRTLDDARAFADRCQHELGVARRRASDVGELADRLRAAWARLRPAEAEYAELDALTETVNGRGQNARRMSLRSYVLASRLEEVAVAATGRLRRMSEGRYSFVHSDAMGRYGKRGGLGLDVLDDYSGRVRSAKTLSGGESFMASLSLALGLADVVAAETGGALLNTLFIDEGFGTLDADTLDLVMNTLDELRTGGRVVGLVSHVDELRQRIPTRLRVRRARTGSTLEVSMN